MWQIKGADIDSHYMKTLLKEGWEPFSTVFSPLRDDYVVFLRRQEPVEILVKDTKNKPIQAPIPKYLN